MTSPTLPGIAPAEEAARERKRAELRLYSDPLWRDNYRRARRSPQPEQAVERGPVQMEMEESCD